MITDISVSVLRARTHAHTHTHTHTHTRTHTQSRLYDDVLNKTTLKEHSNIAVKMSTLVNTAGRLDVSMGVHPGTVSG